MTAPDHGPPGGVPMHDVLLAAVTQQTDRLATAAIELKESYRFSRRLRVTLIIGLVMLALQLVSGVVLIIFAEQNHSLSSTINDCTSPQGKCAQRGKQQTGVAIAQIVARNVEGMIIVNECARDTTTDHELESCVKRHLPR